MEKITSPKLQKDCQYQYPNCQKITDLQYIKKLGSVIISKSWICDNCLAVINKTKRLCQK